MFAPRPFDVAKEMARVTKPGGRIVMGNWIPNDPSIVAQILKISSAYTPPPPRDSAPMTWEIEDDVDRAIRRAGVPEDGIGVCRTLAYPFRFAAPRRNCCAFREILRDQR